MDVHARPTYRIETFGGLAVVGGTTPLTGAATQRKTLLLLAVIAASGAQGISREKLLGMFWAESDAERARNALKQALHILRRDLHEPELVLGGPTLRLNPESITSDVQTFEESLARGELERAAELYRGPFLDGLYLDGSLEFERWVERERGRLAHQHAAALEKLALGSRNAGDHRSAVEWWRRLAATDPLSSRVAVELMTSLAAAGEPETALQHARVHEALVRQELESSPDPSVAALVDRLRADLDAPRAQESATDRTPTLRAQSRDVEQSADPIGESGSGVALDDEMHRQAARPAAPPARDPITVTHTNRRRWAIGVAVVLAITLAAMEASKMYGRARAAPAEASVAVLPFIDIGADPENAYFSDGLSEELITALSHIEGLRVAARTSSFALRDAKLDMRTIGDTLGVATVVEGSVRREGDRLRVTAQLIDAKSGYHLWSQTYDREVKDVFAVQDEIARAIARELRVDPGDAAGSDVAGRTVSNEVYDLYLRGTFFRNRLTREGIAKAIGFFDQAIALDSSYALAYAGKASSMGPLFYFRQVPTEPGLSQMRAAARRALELDDRLGEAHVAMGIIHFFYEWDWPASEREFKRATELNPGDAHAFHMLANYYRAMRRLDNAIAARRHALELDPLNPRTAITLAGDYMNVRQFENAAEQYARAMDIDSLNPLLLGLGPNLPAGPAEVYERQGRHAEAVEEYARVAARRGASPAEMAEMREAFASGGMPRFWLRWLEFEERTSSGEPRPVRVAAIYARRGDIPQALDWLERAHREHDPGLVFLAADPDWDALRPEPRFIAILERMGL